MKAAANVLLLGSALVLGCGQPVDERPPVAQDREVGTSSTRGARAGITSVGALNAACVRPESDMEAVDLPAFGSPSSIWLPDDPHLTVLVLAQPGAPEENVEAISRAIEEWNAVLQECFDGALSIAEMSGGPEDISRADVVLRYTLHRGGIALSGAAFCLPPRCETFVSSHAPPGLPYTNATPHLMYLLTLHELGHALGLGHATNLEESTDIMGYGWTREDDVEISQCDVDALAYLWNWALEGGTEPVRPEEQVVECR